MPKKYCKDTKPEPPRPDTKKPPDDCADRTNCDIGPQTPKQRADCARKIRVAAADFERAKPIPDHPCNCDEVRYENQNFFASFTKGLKKINDFGEVDPKAYCELLKALETGKPGDFENITLGCTAAHKQPSDPMKQVMHELTTRFAPGPMGEQQMPMMQMRLVNPQSALAFDLEGADSHHLDMRPAPAFDSAEEAAEMAELYWQALARDVHFSDYGKEPITKDAINDLNQYSKFTGPKDPATGKVSAKTLFRGFTEGDLAGPYLSQFMLHPIPFGAQRIDALVRTVKRGKNFLTDLKEWLRVQKGCIPSETDAIDGEVFIRNGRDIGQYVHIDVLYQAYFNAMLIMLTKPMPSSGPAVPSPPLTGNAGWGVPFDENNPYNDSQTQEGFGTFGGPHIATLVAEVATRALKAVWYEKWAVHRRLRPEEFGGRVYFHRREEREYPIHKELLDSLNDPKRLGKYFSKKNSLLPMAFPEGCPIHPAYGAGHATVAGACVTILKAWFKEDTKLSELGVVPVVASANGKTLEKYTGADAKQLTVRGELDKLAANIAVGRNHAGVHWRTDYTESVLLGERVAISLLEDSGFTYNEDFKGFTLGTFKGAVKNNVGKEQNTPGCP